MFSKKNIVLIDDDSLFLMLTKRLLETEPYLESIKTFTCVDDALLYLAELASNSGSFPDAVFIDLDMPEIHGLELAQKIHDQYLTPTQLAGGPAAAKSSTKLFILSSSISQRDRQTAENLPAVTDYMEKPLSVTMLRQALELDAPQPKDRQRIAGPGNTQQKGQWPTMAGNKQVRSEN